MSIASDLERKAIKQTNKTANVLNHLDTGYLVNATPPTALARSFKSSAGVFVKV